MRCKLEEKNTNNLEHTRFIEPKSIRPRYWSVADLATYLGVPQSWIYDRTRSAGPEVIPHFKFGKYVRFDPHSAALQAWIDSHGMSVSERD